MNEITKLRCDKLGSTVVQALHKRCFEAYYCENKEAALAKALELIEPSETVGYGGSVSLNELQIKEALRQRGNKLFDRDLAADISERRAIEHQAFSADWFLMSSNAVSEDGQLVNIDGIGNRIAALIYGPKNVLLIVGMNKVVKSLEDAYQRARNTAAPNNMMRFPGLKTPCAVTGACADCSSADCICNQIVITRRSNPPQRIKVLLVGEELGL